MSKKIIFTSLFFVLFAFQIFAQDVSVSGKIEPQNIEIGQKNELQITFKIRPGFHINLQKDFFFIELAEKIKGLKFEPTIYPNGEKDKDGMVFYHNQVTLTRRFLVEKNFATDSSKIKIIAGYQVCDESGTCLFPEEVEVNLSLATSKIIETEKNAEILKVDSKIDLIHFEKAVAHFKIIGKETGYQNSENFVNFLQNPSASSSNKFDGMSIWLIIFLILLGGIALNLTPCVLPMMPITIAVLGAGTQSESKAKGFLIGGVYGLGMALAYGLLGIIVIFTGSQFGTINSSPWFNIIIAGIFVTLALAMFDIIHIDFSKFQSGKVGKKNKSKFITVFVLGIIAAVLAGACVAPVLISVIIYSTSLYTAGNSAGLLLPFLLGVGMAIPWPFAGAGLSFLPKPGNWMKWVKIIFGMIILVIAIFYIYTGVKIFKNNQLTDISKYAHETSELNWNHSIAEGLKLAKKENKPVLIDFWATWCKNCLMMDATTFKDEEVIKEFDNYILVKYQAENMKTSPTKEILDYFEIIGLPTYIVLEPKNLGDK